MRVAQILRATPARQPLIRFLGKRAHESSTDAADAQLTNPHPHPEAPTHSLPDSFVAYRKRAQQHGPLGSGSNNASLSHAAFSSSMRAITHAYGAIGGRSGRELGSVQPTRGQVFDRSDLPARFGRLKWSEEEIELVQMGGAGAAVGWGGA